MKRYLVMFSVLSFLSCTTITSQMENPDALFTIRESREGVIQGEITSRYIPGAAVRGDIEEAPGGIVFYVTEVKLFTAWANGWTEGIVEGSGTFLLTREDTGWKFQTRDALSLWSVAAGEIRYYDTYYRGDDGLRKVKERVDRMLEVSRFLKEEREFLPFYGDIIEETSRGRGFAQDVVSYLFPETEKRFKRKDRKRIFSGENKLYENSSKENVLGADMYWRTAYSNEILPDNIIPLRNSGTLWRDYEEAGPLFFALYNLEYLFHTVLEGAVLSEKK